MEATGDEIDECLRRTERIDWNRPTISFVNDLTHFNVFEKHAKGRNKEIGWRSVVRAMALCKEKALQLNSE